VTESTKNKPNLFLHLQKLKIMKKLIGILLIAFFTLSISTTYAIDYKSTFGIEVKEGDDKKKKKKGEAEKTEAKTEVKSCSPQAGKSCCSPSAVKPEPKKEL
jgi:preprotein translocase subunit SecG